MALNDLVLESHFYFFKHNFRGDKKNNRKLGNKGKIGQHVPSMLHWGNV